MEGDLFSDELYEFAVGKELIMNDDVMIDHALDFPKEHEDVIRKPPIPIPVPIPIDDEEDERLAELERQRLAQLAEQRRLAELERHRLAQLAEQERLAIAEEKMRQKQLQAKREEAEKLAEAERIAELRKQQLGEVKFGLPVEEYIDDIKEITVKDNDGNDKDVLVNIGGDVVNEEGEVLIPADDFAIEHHLPDPINEDVNGHSALEYDLPIENGIEEVVAAEDGGYIQKTKGIQVAGYIYPYEFLGVTAAGGALGFVVAKTFKQGTLGFLSLIAAGLMAGSAIAFKIKAPIKIPNQEQV